jgi:membrane protein YqaA with SNARE-associated domain
MDTGRPWIAPAAGAWGLAEATLFFIVPDVLLTWAALREPRAALRACVPALAGALLGGIVMWGWGLTHNVSAVAALDYVPAISPQMIESVKMDLLDRGPLAVLLGPPTGTPYKVYAVQAGHIGMSLMVFLLVSIPARAVRFVLLAALAGGISHWIGPRLPFSSKRLILTILWIAFYGRYFTIMPN